MLSGVISVAQGLLFILLGDTDMQSWAQPPPDPDDDIVKSTVVDSKSLKRTVQTLSENVTKADSSLYNDLHSMHAFENKGYVNIGSNSGITGIEAFGIDDRYVIDQL